MLCSFINLFHFLSNIAGQPANLQTAKHNGMPPLASNVNQNYNSPTTARPVGAFGPTQMWEVRSCCCRCCLIARLCGPVLANTFISKAASLIRNPNKRSHRSPSTEQRHVDCFTKPPQPKTPSPPFPSPLVPVGAAIENRKEKKRHKRNEGKERGKKVPNNSRYAPSQHNRNKRSQTTAAQAQPIKHDNT